MGLETTFSEEWGNRAFLILKGGMGDEKDRDLQ
jgi:hypothetical protein